MKKILAILLTVCMVVCMIPGAAFAEEKPDLATDNVTIEDLLYNGNTQTANVSIVDETNTDNYTITYSATEIKNVGTYTATVKITNDSSKYKKDSAVTKTFKIIPVDFSASMDIEKTVGFVSGDIENGEVKDTSLNDIVVKQGGHTVDSGLYTKTATYDAASGKITVTVTSKNADGTNVIGGSRFKYFNIVKTIDSTNYFISPNKTGGKADDTIADQTYQGYGITPKLYLYDKTTNKTLTEGTDFDFVYSNNVNAMGNATVTVKGKGNYTNGTSLPQKTFKILPKALTKYMVSVKDTNVGTAPEVVVKDGSKTLIKDTDYELSYEYPIGTVTNNFSNAGTYNVVVTGKDNYKDTVKKEFSVTQGLPGFHSATVSTKSVFYNGSVQTPVVTVYEAEKTPYSKSYTVKFRDANGNYVSPKDAGTYEIVIVGTGSNVGTKVLSDKFTINTVELKEKTDNYAIISGLDAYYSYANKPVEPTFGVYWNKSSVALKKGTDYIVRYTNNTSVGTGTITVTFMGNFRGSITRNFTIQKGNELSKYTVYIPNIADQAYTGTYVKPYVSVYYGGATSITAKTLLTENVHYTLSYSSNINAGTATVTVTGKGAYSGTVTKNFNIKYNLSNATVTTTPATYAYDGRIKQPAVTVKIGYVTVPASDYIVTYSNNLKVGTATATVTAKTYGKSMGSNMAYFTITGKDGVITPEYAEYSKKTTKSKPFAIKIVSNTTDGTGYSYVSSDTSVATVSANGTVTPVGCGRTVITITTTGNRAYNPATATVTVTVKPTKGIISSLKSTAKGKLTVRYKKQSPNADYYQIRYGRAGDYTTKTIKNSSALTGKSTIKGLQSGKKYYVKVRGVKVLEDGTRLYGAWSVTKNAVTK